MCLGIPGRVVALVDGYGGQLAVIDVVGTQRQVNIGMLDQAPDPGDWVLIHMGFAVEVIDEDKARAAMSGLELMGRARTDRIRRRFDVYGVVQGVGYRPFVYASAAEFALAGSVANTADGVVIEVEGDADAVAEFGARLRADAPPLAVVAGVHESDLPTEGGTGFTIADSRDGSTDGSSGGAADGSRSRTLTSPDVATCQDCLDELRDPTNRRYRHPLITCTNCGPRYTIITGLPYDRATTTMAGFAMCDTCRTEYNDPGDRRFHAQPIACHDCGPQFELLRSDAGSPALGEDASAARGEDALRAARALLAAGRIVAVKGLGGYHLACDARNAVAVAELRRRKRRGGKPFAVMVADLDVARGLVRMTADEAALLTGIRKPIVLLPRRTPGRDPSGLADAVAPGNPDLGLMLPYTPVHELLFGLDGDPPGPDALVMTSGNASGEPIVTDDDEAATRLAPLVDAWLRHNRPIQVSCDDSVSRFVAGADLPIRRSRGYAPLPISLPFEVAPTLAVGADLKNTCALGSGRYAWVSQHIGDMDDLATVEALTGTERHLELLTGVRPAQLVADLHPGYRSSRWARDHAEGRAVHTVQHHHAHIASVMGEHGLGPDEQVIGFAFDGTGYGTDGAVWGGEVLVAGYKSFRRTAHLGYVPLAGGDASVLRPFRMALAHLRVAGVAWDEHLPSVRACPQREREVLAHQLDTGFGCVPTSSMGRLFDAIASLAGVRHQVDYEAEAAIELEGLARTGSAARSGSYAFDLQRAPMDEPIIADPGPVIRAAAADALAGVAAERIAARFHAAVAGLIVDLAEICREQTGLGVVALGGGVFANALLLDAAHQELTGRDFTVLRPRLLPPNDGGIALGQLLIGASG